MRYRWKLLLLLVAIGVLPILAMRTLGVQNARRLGQALVSQSRAEMIAQTQSRLKLLADSYAQSIAQSRDQVEMALMFQVKETELAMSEAASSLLGLEATGLSGHPLTQSPAPHVTGPSMHILWPSSAAGLPPGPPPADMAERIQRLMRLGPFYRQFARLLGDQVLWYVTVFSDGLLGIYPSSALIPADFDPRRQPWYKKGFEAEFVWSKQYVDPISGENVVALSAPVTAADGRTAAVSALVVPIRRFFERPMVLENVPFNTQCLIAYLSEREPGKNGVRILARETHFKSQASTWQAPAAEWLAADDSVQFQEVIADFQAGRGNVRRLTFNLCDCLWVYRPIHGDAFLVLIMPFAETMKPVEQSEADIQAEVGELLRVTRLGIFFILIVVVLLAFAFARTVTRPMQILTEGARRLAGGDFDTRVDIRSRDEFGEMGRIFNLVGPRLEENYQLRHSLDLAKEVQQSLLPESDPRIEGLDIAGTSIYCEETGGDYFDYIASQEAPGQKVTIVVGDVCGHGLPSALLMTSVRAQLRQRAAMPGDLKSIVADVNRQVALDNPTSGQFVTLFLADADMRTHSLRWVRAGHEPALFYDPGSDGFLELGGRGAALGIAADSVYEEGARRLLPGQVVVIGTDGIWEARDASGRMFGKHAFQEVIRAHARKDSRELIAAVIRALEEFRGDLKGTEDDITLVVMKAT
jgi:sigma-B regulation protein RsbU (phosphoserine phosphatase)